jgi:hypothetical protein
MKLFAPAVLAVLALAGCAAQAPQSPAQTAEDQACTSQADAQYQQQTINEAGHTAQTGLMFPATPSHVFDSENLGAEHVRESQIQDCETTGNNNGQPEVNGVPVVAPHIITQ